MQIRDIALDKILFLDIETVPICADFADLDERGQALWTKKTERWQHTEQTDAEAIYNRAAIFAEFAKVVCISVGLAVKKQDDWVVRIKSFYGDDEKSILQDFAYLLENKCHNYYLCAHNGKEFDYPFLSRRMLVQGITLPNNLNVQGKKPWETEHLLDTMHLWRFGDHKNYTSLDLLAYTFGIETPKSDISGADVAKVYYQEQDLARIVRYCEKDVLTIMQIFRKMRGEDLLGG
jgi:uncharacterized protein YprB with RNaseH-like and TPR domain